MLAEQISVFLENRSGRLEEVTRILAETGIDIRALSVADTSDFGVLRLIVSDSEKATAVLKQSGLAVRKTGVVATEVEDRPGGLLKILEAIQEAGLNIEYMYTCARMINQKAVMIFRFDQTDRAIAALESKGIALVDQSRLVSG